MDKRKVGDIYELLGLSSGLVCLQHITNDETQLGSQVVRVYRPEASVGALSAIGEDLFFAHVFLKAGETLNRWRKIGHCKVDSSPRLLWCKCADMERQKATTEKWWIWVTNEAMIPVSNEWDLLQQSELGLVINPNAVCQRAGTGQWSIRYPAKPSHRAQL